MSEESKVKINDLFEAESKTIKRIFGVDSTGFYIPAYQRDYSWDDEKVERLLDDVLFGTYNTLENHKSITFLGTIIVVEMSNDNDQKIARGTAPEAILGIVDGQQRLTTLLMLIVALHSELRTYTNTNDNFPEQIKKIVNRFLGDLQKLYMMDISNEYDETEKNTYVLYPKIIRTGDVWSDDEKTHLKAFYESPVSKFIWQYINFSTDVTSSETFDYEHSSDNVAHNNFRSTFDKIKKYIKNKVKKEHDEINFPPVTSIVNEIATVFKSFISLKDLDKECLQKHQDLIRLMFFIQFFLERVAITQIRAGSEDFAFDMFESLNSTGEPLTAFETFRPKIIIQDKEGSEDNQNIAKEIASILDSTKIEEKKTRTENFIIAFAVAEIGHKLPKKLYMQRSFLRESFNNTLSEDRQHFINHMYSVAKFMQHFWFSPDIAKENSRSFGLSCEVRLQNDALMCLQYLREVNHTVAIPILSRYYTSILMTPDEEHKSLLFNYFESVVKSVTAFSILWRAFVGGTSGIDTVYRDLVAGKLKIIEGLVFARRIRKDLTVTGMNHEMPSLDQLKKAFKAILREHKQTKISSKEDWVKKVSDSPIYSKQKEVSKFIILAAFHLSQTNKNEGGMLKRGSNRGGQETLSVEMWEDNSFSLEHIAPQDPQFWGGSDIYEDTITVHKLGNLVFVDKSVNATLSNKPWNEKKPIFDLLSTQDDEDFRKKSEHLNIKLDIDKLERYGFLPHLSSLALVEAWDKAMIESRTENLLSLAWDTIYSWLED